MNRLLKIQLLDFFNINKTLHCNDPKEKRRLYLMSVIFLIVFACLLWVSFMYTFSLARAYKEVGLINLFLPLLMLTSSILTFITTLYKANGLLFRFKDYELLMSLPIKTSIVIGSRVLLLYIMSLLFNVILMLPGCIAYAINTSPHLGFYIVFTITFFFIPLIPIILATFVGALISFIASRFKSTQFVSLILTFAFLIGYMGFSMQMQGMDVQIVDLSQTILSMMTKIYPIAPLYAMAVGELNASALLLFVVISLFAFFLFTILLSKSYKSLNTRLASSSTHSVYKQSSLKPSSCFMALYKKELKRYFSSSLYILNTGFGVVLLIIVSIIFALSGGEGLDELLKMPGLKNILHTAAPFAMSLFCVMSCTTACSLSLEGANLWIIKSSPIKALTFYLSKVAVNLTIVIPAILISGLIFAFTLKTTLLETLLIFLLPFAYTLWIAFVGIFINLKFPSFNWTSEVVVIKQSISAMLTPFIGILSLGIAFIPLLFSKEINLTFLAIVTSLCLFLFSFLLYVYIRKNGEQLLYTL